MRRATYWWRQLERPLKDGSVRLLHRMEVELFSSSQLKFEVKTLALREAFRIAHGSTRDRRVLRLSHGEACSEAPFVPYYDDCEEGVLEWLERQDWAGRNVEALLSEAPRVARTALDVLWHDLEARRLQQPLWRALNLGDPNGVVGCRSIGLPQDLNAFSEQVREYSSRFRVLKLKLGSGDLMRDEAIVAAAREANPEGRMFVDVNGGWDVSAALLMFPRLRRYGIGCVEQPIHRDESVDAWRVLFRAAGDCSMRLMADESICGVEDLRKLSECVNGVNVKLLKAGGISGAMELIRESRRLGKKVLLGCMIESSLGVTAAAHLAGCVDGIDLDGHLYVSQDDFKGLRYDEHGRLQLGDGHGIGAQAL